MSNAQSAIHNLQSAISCGILLLRNRQYPQTPGMQITMRASWTSHMSLRFVAAMLLSVMGLCRAIAMPVQNDSESVQSGVTVKNNDWAPAKGPLATRWTEEVRPDATHQDYPRPQIARKD